MRNRDFYISFEWDFKIWPQITLEMSPVCTAILVDPISITINSRIRNKDNYFSLFQVDTKPYQTTFCHAEIYFFYVFFLQALVPSKWKTLKFLYSVKAVHLLSFLSTEILRRPNNILSVSLGRQTLIWNWTLKNYSHSHCFQGYSWFPS